MNHLTDIGVLLDELFYHFLRYGCGSSCNVMLLLPTAARSCRQPSSGIELYLKSTDFSALLIFGTIPFHEGKSGHKLVNIGRMQTKSISNNTKAASGSTYDCGSAAAMASAPPAPISLAQRSRLVNALLTRMVNGQKCSTENKFVSIGRMQTKQNSHSS